MENELLKTYNIEWDSPSKNSSENMPCGGHDTGLCVWVEDGYIRFYIDKSGSFDENNLMLKLGRIRFDFDNNPFSQPTCKFKQTLDLKTGRIYIKGQCENYPTINITIWCETQSSVVHVDIVSSSSIKAKVHYDTWRFEDRIVPNNQRVACYSMRGYPGDIITRADTIQFKNNGVLFYHQNQNEHNCFQKVVKIEQLGHRINDMYNPQKDLIFGGYVFGENLLEAGTDFGEYAGVKYKDYILTSKNPSTSISFIIALNSEFTPVLNNYVNNTIALAQRTTANAEVLNKISFEFWNTYWERSAIDILPNNSTKDKRAWQVGRNYNLFRYMLGCNVNGAYPTKFNGGLFTSDACYSIPERVTWYASHDGDPTPDFRIWGGGSMTAQNQRLVYWPMLKTGDFDAMPPQFNYYNNSLVNAKIRTQEYWGHEGCSFCEQLESFGLPIGYEWGWPNSEADDSLLYPRCKMQDPTEVVRPWIKYHYSSQLEFSYMILKYYIYSGNDISEYIDFIDSSITFFDKHYRYIHLYSSRKNELNSKGELVIFPSTALESYKDATNPVDVISGMNAILKIMLYEARTYISDEKAEYYESILKIIPPIPFREYEGKKIISPAQSFSDIMNVELPQLYPVFPYEDYGLTKVDLQVAIDTFYGPIEIHGQYNHISWHQDNIFAARLGLVEEAKEITFKKLENSERRFPAYWGPGHDWTPDHNWGGSGMIGLQEMLMQCYDDKILILPAWDKELDVHFKLHAPKNTLVEVWYQNGKIDKIEVLPKEREKDIVICKRQIFTTLTNPHAFNHFGLYMGV